MGGSSKAGDLPPAYGSATVNVAQVADVVQVQETVSYSSRVGGSFLGLPVGALCVAGGAALLWWNEHNAVEGAERIDRLSAEVRRVDGLNPDNEGCLVHYAGPVRTREHLEDDEFVLDPPPGFEPGPTEEFGRRLLLGRTVETYQWVESRASETKDNLGGSQTKTTTYKYNKKWAAGLADSSSFHSQRGHENPTEALESTTRCAELLELGPFRLEPKPVQAVLELISERFLPEGEVLFKNGRCARSGDWFYVTHRPGRVPDPHGVAEVGDTRVQWRIAADKSVISVVALQQGRLLTRFEDQMLVQPGRVAPAQMLRQARASARGAKWLIRLGGLLIQYVGFRMMGDPLVTLAALVPFLSRFVALGVNAVAVPSAVGVTGLTIAMAFVSARVKMQAVRWLIKIVYLISVGLLLKKLMSTAAGVAARGASAVGSGAKTLGSKAAGLVKQMRGE